MKINSWIFLITFILTFAGVYSIFLVYEKTEFAYISIGVLLSFTVVNWIAK